MTYIVVKKFRDKHTQEIQEKGSDYKPKNDKRAAELVKLGFIEKVEVPKQEDPKEEQKEEKPKKNEKKADDK